LISVCNEVERVIARCSLFFHGFRLILYSKDQINHGFAKMAANRVQSRRYEQVSAQYGHAKNLGHN
jgi:hypothetical protein